MAESPVLQPDDHHMLRYYAAINRVVRPAMHRVFLLLQPDNGKSIRELLFDISGFSEGKYKKQYNEQERRKIDECISSDEFDITLLYKLLQSICGLVETNDPKWSTTGTIENSLKRLKEYRNILAHEQISSTFDDLERCIRDMEGLCHDVLKGAGEKGRDIEKMHDKMQEVLSGGIDLWEPYKIALSELRNEQTAVLAREGRKDIHKLGENLKILNPFAWLIDADFPNLNLENIYTENRMQSREKIDTSYLLVSRYGHSYPLPDVIIISGTPGMGKTSLFRYLVQDWLSSNPTVLGMENINLVVPVVLRNVHSNNIKDLLKDELLFNVAKHLCPDDIISALKNISLLWMLDGYDEASIEIRNVIKEIIKKFPDSRILITTRTEFTDEIETDLRTISRSFVRVTLEGFSNAGIKEYANKIITASTQGCEGGKYQEFLNFIEDGNRWRCHILRVPLFAAIMVILWLNSPESVSRIKTTTNLYNLLVEHIIQRTVTRKSFRNLNQTNGILKGKVNRLVDYIGCLMCLRDYPLYLHLYEVDDLIDKCSELGVPFMDSISAFFVYDRTATPFGIEERYTVIHRAIIDFLAARAFANKMISEGWDLMVTTEYFFKMKRETLLNHEPTHQDLDFKYDIDNLSMDLPSDIFENFRKKYFKMPSDCFAIKNSSCELCSTHREIANRDFYFQTKKISTVYRSRKWWWHAKSYLSGPWLIFVLGYVSLRKQLSEERCEQFSFIFCNSVLGMYPCFVDFLIAVKEADNPLFTKKMCDHVKQRTWAFQHSRWLSDAKAILDYVHPESIFLHLCEKSPHSCQFLLECIETFANHSCEVHIDMRNFFVDVDPDLNVTQTCLERILLETSHYQLITLRAVVNDDCLWLLKKASYLRKLTLKFCGQNLLELAELIRTLPELEYLALAIDFRCCSGEDLPVLIEDKTKIPKPVVMFTDIFSFNPEHVASALKTICPNPHHVILQGSILYINAKRILTYIAWVLVKVQNVKILQMFLGVTTDYYTRKFHFERPILSRLRKFTRNFFFRTKIKLKLIVDKSMIYPTKKYTSTRLIR